MAGTGKMQFGTNNLGRQRRIVTCNASTLDGCEWMPNFKGSQRGCVLKVTNDYLTRLGVKKRSQIDAINNTDHSNHGYKKILKILESNIKSGQDFKITFMTPELVVKTVEIFFRGAFCPSVEFCAEGDGTNFIIENIPYESDGKILTDKAQLKRGYRVTKVKSNKVTGKPYDEIRKMILQASNDMRVDYSVTFEEGDMSWYNFDEPIEPKKNKKHERKGSGRFVHTKKKSTRNLLKSASGRKSRHVRGSSSKGNKSKSSMSFDFASVDWTKEREQHRNDRKRKNSGDISDSGGHSPSFSSLASVAEDKHIPEFDAFTLDEDDGGNKKLPISNKPALQIIHSGGLRPNEDQYANIGASDDGAITPKDNNNNINNKPTPVKTEINNNNNNNSTTQRKRKGSGDLRSLLTPNAGKKKKRSVNFKDKKLKTIASINISEDKDKEKEKEKQPTKPITPPPIDVDIICDLCKTTFTIKDNELQYHSLNMKQVGKSSLFGIAESTEEDTNLDASSPITPAPKTPLTKDKDIKYNGLCKQCIKMECNIELSKIDSIMLAPHLSGHSVCISYVDPNIHKYIKWLIEDDEDKKDDEKDDKIKDDKTKDNKSKKKKKSKYKSDKNRKITENFIVLAINDIDVEMESFEVVFAMFYQQSGDNKKIRLKLKKYFNEDHSKIVNSYHNHLEETIAMKRAIEEQQKAMIAKRALLTRNTNKEYIDSDPDVDDESDSDELDYDTAASSRPSSVRYHSRGINSGGRGVGLKRNKSRKHLKKKSIKSIRMSNTSNYEESDYGAAEDEHKTVQQLIEEHDGMAFIREGERLERNGEWESAAITYERGVQILADYQKDLQLSTREKRTYRQELAEYRRKMLLVQNRLIRKSTTPRHSRNMDDNNKKDGGNDSEGGGGGAGGAGGEEGDDGKKKEKINKDKDPDKAFRDRLMGDIITEAPNISFKDVTGLLNVKLALYECIILPQKRPELFTGLRKPTAGLLLFGPPGNGKTMIAKCIATEVDATFFSISASSITSKYVGEAERIMRTLFNMAREKQPSIIFIDEIDSLLTQRGGNNEAESSRRIKTEFLVQFDGVKATADGKEARVLVVGATNLPEQLDEAVLRRFGKRILVPVPDEDARYGILRNLAAKQTNTLTEQDFRRIVQKTNLYSASDLTQVCKDASMGPLRDLGTAVLDMDQQIEVPPIQLKHFEASLKNVRASVKQESLIAYQKWDSKFGSKLTFKLSALPQNMHAHPIEPLQ